MVVVLILGDMEAILIFSDYFAMGALAASLMITGWLIVREIIANPFNVEEFESHNNVESKGSFDDRTNQILFRVAILLIVSALFIFVDYLFGSGLLWLS